MAKKPKSKSPLSFEAALKELETLTEEMEEESLPLNELVKAYERGQDLLNFCRKSLTSARESIEVTRADKADPALADELPGAEDQPDDTTDDDVRLF